MEGKGDGEVENWVLSDLLLCPEEQTVAEHTHTKTLSPLTLKKSI